MEKITLDTHAAAAFFYNEPGADMVEKILLKTRKKAGMIIMSAVNYGELFYAVLKKSGNEAALKARDMLDAIPVKTIEADRNIALLAGSYKAGKKMSFADCFCAATARIHGASIVTGDRDFKEVEGEIEITWIR
jgi:ribonuclease VapC